MYITSGSCPDIAFAISKLSHFVTCYWETHWQAALHVVCYLKGTHDWSLCLYLSRTLTTPCLLRYSNSDYANNPGPQGQQSVGGYCFSLGSSMISWSSKQQKTVATSTCTAKYITVSEASRELIWIQNLLSE